MADKTAFAVDALTVASSHCLNVYLENPPYAAFLVKEQAVQNLDAASKGGILWLPDGLFTLRGSDGRVMKLRLSTDEILYAGQGDDFADATRKALQTWTQ